MLPSPKYVLNMMLLPWSRESCLRLKILRPFWKAAAAFSVTEQ